MTRIQGVVLLLSKCICPHVTWLGMEHQTWVAFLCRSVTLLQSQEYVYAAAVVFTFAQ